MLRQLSIMVSARTLGYWRKKRLRRTPTYTLCLEHATTPAIGGIEVLDVHLTSYPYLPAYVVLHNPSNADIWASNKMRCIFLNQTLLPWEHEAVAKFRDMLKADMKLPHDQELPRWLVPHLSRILQQCKYKPDAAMKLWPQLFEERVAKLPIKYEDVRAGLAYGFVYFHGRDTRCRPLLTIRMGRAEPFMGEPDLIKKVFLYSMEFAVRYLLVPGRVENWSVLIDCAGVEKIDSMWQAKGFAQAIATSLGKVYSGRMAWTKIFNFPKSFGFKALKYFVEGIISAMGKSDKVAIVSSKNVLEELRGQVELGQLEKSFGGTAPDLEPAETFPFRMFDSPEGYTGQPVEHVTPPSPAHGVSQTPSGATQASSLASVVPTSVHLMTDVQFHEGMLCANCLDEGTGWRHRIQKLPLPKNVAEDQKVQPCTNISEWCEKMAQVVGLRDRDNESESSFRTGASGGSKDKIEPGGALRGPAYSITEEDETAGLSMPTDAIKKPDAAANGSSAAADGALGSAKAEPSQPLAPGEDSGQAGETAISTTSANQVTIRAVASDKLDKPEMAQAALEETAKPPSEPQIGAVVDNAVAPQTSACTWQCWRPSGKGR